MIKNLSTLLSFLVICLFSLNVIAQGDQPFADLPPTSEYGKCYAKCKVPDVYETVESQKMVKEASSKLVKVPARYETVTEQILVKDASTKYKTVPARYSNATEKVLIKDAETVIRTLPAKYENRSRQVLVEPARGQWVRKKRTPSCFSSNPEDCYVACWEEVAAKYRTEKYQVLVQPASTTETTVPAKYKTITKRVLSEPARVEEIAIPAVYKTITKKKLVSSATTQETNIPAIYKTVSDKRLLSKGGYTTWQEILCAAQTTNSKVRNVQQALKGKGYNPGPIDGVMGAQTKSSLVKYQQDNGLPVGNMNIKTLQSLGVNN